MGTFVILLLVAVAMFCTVAAVIGDPESRSVPQCAGLIAGFVSGMVVGGQVLPSLGIALVLGGSFRGYAAFVDLYADGSEMGFFFATCVFAAMAPVFLLALPRDLQDVRDRRRTTERRAAEQLWRDEFAASGATDPLAFTPRDPRAVMPRSAMEVVQRDLTGEQAPTIHDGARRAAEEARARSEARRAYLDSRRFKPRR